MYYYQSPDNSLHALDSQAFEYLLPVGSKSITAAQYATLSAPPTPTTAQIIAEFEAAVQGYLDNFAQTWNYESILSAASYASSTVTQFKNEALALIAWRDAVWSACYAAEAAIKAGTQAMPVSTAAFIATLPVTPAKPI